MRDRQSTETTDTDEESSAKTDSTTQTASSSAKVVGEFADSSGAGVRGTNTASGGTPIGVEGEVPSAPNDGYGLYTQHDAKVDGVAELAGLSGSVTGGTELSSLTGQNLDIDDGGQLTNTGPTYVTNSFTSSGESWNPVSGLSTQTPVEVTVDTNSVTGGRVAVDVDGSQTELLNRNDVLQRVVLPTNSVTVRGTTGWTFAEADDLSSNITGLTGIAFEDDGSRLFASVSDPGTIYQYDLSTPWDISASGNRSSLDVSSEENFPEAITFRSDGTRLYVYGSTEEVYSYKLGTAWDITSTLSLRSNTIGTGAAFAFKHDGSKLYITDNNDALVRSYKLSTSWDTSTATFKELFFALDSLEEFSGIAFNSDGTRLYLAGFQTFRVFIYSLSSAWDLSTASLELTYDVSDRTTNVRGVALRANDSEMYLPSGLDVVYSYNRGFSGTAAATLQME